MPPIKTYEFESIDSPNIKVLIQCYEYNQALRILERTVKDSDNYKSVNL
ncbi:hypothetical protein ACFSRZ_01855 [Pseudotenacibaculum haliotis]|uniref:Uncharacterized protein n=1 Tax=Pseudotenacibaculum haliotis TaxID=1862138 RepID=A0ABW5LPP0_9FLAO